MGSSKDNLCKYTVHHARNVKWAIQSFLNLFIGKPLNSILLWCCLCFQLLILGNLSVLDLARVKGSRCFRIVIYW